MGDEGATMEKILADVRSKSGSSPEGEPSAMVATGVMIADGNGMSYGAAPRSAASSTADQGHAGAYREIIKRLDVLKEMESVEVAREQEESQGHMMIPHRQNPVTFVQTNDRNVVIRKTGHDQMAVVYLQKSAQQTEEEGQEER